MRKKNMMINTNPEAGAFGLGRRPKKGPLAAKAQIGQMELKKKKFHFKPKCLFRQAFRTRTGFFGNQK